MAERKNYLLNVNGVKDIAKEAVSFDLLTPDELSKELNSCNEQTTDISLHDKELTGARCIG